MIWAYPDRSIIFGLCGTGVQGATRPVVFQSTGPSLLEDDPILGNSKPMPVVRAVQIRLTHVWSPACKLTVSRVSGSRPVKDWCVLPGQQHGPEVLRLHYW